MSEQPPTATPATPAVVRVLERAEIHAIVGIVLRIGAILLSAGSGTDDVEATMRRAARGLGLSRIQAIVTFNTISVSTLGPRGGEPVTAVHLVEERHANYARLAAAADLARDLRTGSATLAEAPARLDAIDAMPDPWPAWSVTLAMGVLTAAATILFGGDAIDAGLAAMIGLIVQPVMDRIDESGLPPFFRKLIGPIISAIGVVIALKLGLPIHGGAVLAGTLLRFLPGAALVAGTRDLIGQSIVSGSARLMETMLFGAAVGGGLFVVIAGASAFGVTVSPDVLGDEAWQAPVRVAAAGIACGAYAIRLGIPRRVLGSATLLGASGYAVYIATNALFGTATLSSTTTGVGGTATGTFAAAITVGFVGRLIARRVPAPVILWVVPAEMPLLPGLRIVRGMLGASSGAGLPLLVDAVLTGFLLGIGVALGDIVLTTLTRVQEEVVTASVAVAAPVASAYRDLRSRVPHSDRGHGAGDDSSDEDDLISPS